jgi:hypothetical protein
MSTMFYDKAVALNRERHQKLRLKVTPDHFAFAKKTNALPIASTEFTDAARDYPIVFVGQEGGPFGVAALVGLRNQSNLLVKDDGTWQENTYVPAFARRYPFVLAGEQSAAQLTVCVDESYAGLNDSEGEPLFNENGEETNYLQRVLQFLKLFHREMDVTNKFATRLAELGLLTEKVITVESSRGKEYLKGIWIVDDAKLKGIDDARVVELFRSGYLQWIAAHKISLGNVRRLASRLDEKSKLGADSTFEAEEEGAAKA